MGRLTADTATRQIKKVLGEKMSLVLDSKSSEKVEYTITYNKNNAQIKAFFDLQSQLYGFVMYNRGIKTYEKIELFAEMLNVYMYINTELIPITQKIVELYSRENGLTTKYITFTGNLNEGFTTQFEVAGEARFVFVTEQETNVYRLTLVESHDKKKYKTLDMYLYLLQPDGTFEKRFMILSAANKLFERCFDLGEDYSLRRVETNSFVFTYGDLTVDFSLNITDVIEYAIHGVNGEAKEFSFVLDDFLDIDAFITAVLDRIGGKLGGSQSSSMPTYDNDNAVTDDVDAVSVDDIDFEDSDDTTEDDTTEDDSIDKEMNALDAEIDMSDDMENDNEDTEDIGTDDLFEANENTDDTISEDELENNDEIVEEPTSEETQEFDGDMFEPSETVEEPEPVDEQSTEEDDMGTDLENEVETTEIENETKENEVESKEIVTETKENEVENKDIDLDGQTVIVSKLNRDGNLVGLLFNVEDKLYIANIESLKPYRIPYKRLVNTEVEVQKKGYAVWESEAKLKTFADDISENTDLLNQLFEMMF